MAALELKHNFGALDAVFLNFESKEMPLHIGCVAVCDGVLPFEQFVAGIQAKLDLIPRYRQKVMRPFLNIGLPTWQYDPDFDIRRHIFHLKLDAPGTEEQLRELTGRLFTELLDRNKPLWEVYIVDGLEGDRSAIIAKVHHCMVDGVSGVALMNIMFDPSPETPPLPKPKRYRPPKPPDATKLFTEALTNTFKFTIDQLSSAQKNLVRYGMTLMYDERAMAGVQKLLDIVPQLMAPIERLPFNRPCSGVRRVAWSQYSFTDARAIRTACGGSVNDVVLTVLTGAMMRYLKLHKESLKNRFYRVMVPVNLRQEDERGTLGNCISMLPVSLPLFITDPVERLKHISAQTEAMKHAHVAELLRAGISWLGALPVPLQTLAGALPMFPTPVPIVHTISTNVPGPQVPIYANGRRLLTLWPYVPVGWEVGLALAIQSYDQKMFFGLTIDAQAAPDGERMKGFLDASFAELRKAAGVHPAEAPVAGPSPKAEAKPKAKRKARKPKPAPAPPVEPVQEPPQPVAASA